MSGFLTEAQVEGFRKTLLARQHLLKQELRVEKAGPVAVESESQGYEEAYLDGLGKQVDSEVTAQHRIELDRIAAALRRIDDGTYGICEDCDGPIGLARLQAFPTARLCIECKELHERGMRSGT